MKSIHSNNRKKWLLILPVILIVGVFAYLNRNALHRPAEDSIVQEPGWREAEEVDKAMETEPSTTEPAATETPATEDKEVTFLLAGIDRNSEADGLNASSRTDVLIVTKVNFTQGTIDFINIPRDTRVMVNGQPDKINHAHAYGGMPLALTAVSDFLGVPIRQYAKLSFESVEYIVDAMGGMDVQLNETVASAMGRPAGYNRLNGQEALYYLRYRAGYDNADIGRVQAQQQFLLDMGKQMLEPAQLPKLPGIYQMTQQYIDTNIKDAEIMDWLNLARGLNRGGITTTIIDGHSERIDGLWYWIPDETQVEQVVKEKLQGESE